MANSDNNWNLADELARAVSGPSARVRPKKLPNGRWSVYAQEWLDCWVGLVRGPTGYGNSAEEALQEYISLARKEISRSLPQVVTTEMVPAKEVSALRGVTGTLPKCSCGFLAVGYHTRNRRVIGRKVYGGEEVPFCGICQTLPDFGPFMAYPYEEYARNLNSHFREIGKDPTIPVDTSTVQG